MELTSGSDSSSSGWSTCRVATGAYTRDRGQKGSERLTLEGEARAFPLGSAWPTPAVIDSARSGDALRQMTIDAGERGFRKGVSLHHEVANWPTPAARDYRAPNSQDSQDSQDKRNEGSSRGQQLPNFVEHMWSTPAVADVQGGRMTRSGERSNELLLNGQTAFLSGHLDPTTSTDGAPRSTSGLQLNPLFVEWLMGWPAGWTLFACSATELSRFKQRMRSALSRLAWPADPPAQLSLFG